MFVNRGPGVLYILGYHVRVTQITHILHVEVNKNVKKIDPLSYIVLIADTVGY